MVRYSWVLLYSAGLNVYVGRSPRSPPYLLGPCYSMPMLMLLERIIYFVFVFRMLLPFFIHVSENWGTMRS